MEPKNCVLLSGKTVELLNQEKSELTHGHFTMSTTVNENCIYVFLFVFLFMNLFVFFKSLPSVPSFRATTKVPNIAGSLRGTFPLMTWLKVGFYISQKCALFGSKISFLFMALFSISNSEGEMFFVCLFFYFILDYF